MKFNVVIFALGMALLPSVNSFSLKSQNESYQNRIEQSQKYCGIENSSTQEKVISYDYKQVDEIDIQKGLPLYYANESTSNCANVAGAEILAYYDVIYEDIIPEYKVYTQLGSIFKFKYQSSEIAKVIDELYSLMGTDSNGAGTTFSGFEMGMKQYLSKHGGFTYKSESLKSSGLLDLSKYLSSIQKEIPVALFLPQYTIVKSIVESENYDTIYFSYNTLAHVAAAFGYRKDTYYKNNSVIATETYLKISSGFPNIGVAYIDIQNTIFNEIISVSIS